MFQFIRDGTVHHFEWNSAGHGASRKNIRKKIKCWRDSQHMVMRRRLIQGVLISP
jgi:hypothetical protein